MQLLFLDAGQSDKRFVANYKDGAWDNGTLTEDDKVVINECAGVLQYAQTCFEGLKAYTTEDGTHAALASTVLATASTHLSSG